MSLQLAASDPDGNPLTYSATGLPAGLGINPNTGLISGTLTFTSAGTYTVTATASDGAATDSKAFSWTVTDVPPGPEHYGTVPVQRAGRPPDHDQRRELRHQPGRVGGALQRHRGDPCQLEQHEHRGAGAHWRDHRAGRRDGRRHRQ